ncbi:MAG: metallophosphoesterase [Sulfuricurvum sp.]|jgi:serine/threonine protein phosphatase 1
MHYVIGDVHGYYNTLMALVAKLPSDAKLIFVGDLIDRGLHSAEVIHFIRTNNHLSVMGNHEYAMVQYGNIILKALEHNYPLPQECEWYNYGGIRTLNSYGLVKMNKGTIVADKIDNKKLNQFRSDLIWMKNLPIFIELKKMGPSKSNIVISHAPTSLGWAWRRFYSILHIGIEHLTSNRKEPEKNNNFFNIFGHTPTKHTPKIRENFINIDTGCYRDLTDGYGMLCAYCIETCEIIVSENHDNRRRLWK